jgi:hypothetical protein
MKGIGKTVNNMEFLGLYNRMANISMDNGRMELD